MMANSLCDECVPIMHALNWGNLSMLAWWLYASAALIRYLDSCSAPSLVAAPPSSPSQQGWALVTLGDKLSHSLVTEQWGWGWTTGDPDMRTCNEVHCHNQELQHPGFASHSLKSDVQPWVIENCWVSFGGTNLQLITCTNSSSMQTTQLAHCLP